MPFCNVPPGFGRRSVGDAAVWLRRWVRGGHGPGVGASNDIRLHCPASPQIGFSDACYLSVYFDGAQIWAWNQPDPPNLDDYLVGSLEGIEVYRGPSELPPQFHSTSTPCVAILLWTRTGEGS